MDRYNGHDSNLVRHNGKKLLMRSCPAIEDVFLSGYTIHLPADIYIDASSKQIEFYIPNVMKPENINNEIFLQKHDPSVTDGFEAAKDFHEEALKWHPFWGVKTEEGYSTFFMHPINRQDLPFLAVSAIVDTDTFPAREPFAFFVKKGFVGTISRGTPILTAFPFKREEWESEIVSYDEFDRKRKASQIHTVFKHPYKKIFWHRKKFN